MAAPHEIFDHTPLMLVEIFHRGRRSDFDDLRDRSTKEQSQQRSWLQGAYLYEFQELPAAIVGVLDAHFAQVGKDLATKIEAIASTFKPKLRLVKR